MKDFKTKKGAELTFTKKPPKSEEMPERQASLLRKERQKQALENLQKLEQLRTQRKPVDPLASEKEKIRLEVLAERREAKKNEKGEREKLLGDVMEIARKPKSARTDADEKRLRELEGKLFERHRTHPVVKAAKPDVGELDAKKGKSFQVRYRSKKDDPKFKLTEFKMNKRRELKNEINKIENKECLRAFNTRFGWVLNILKSLLKKRLKIQDGNKGGSLRTRILIMRQEIDYPV